MLEFRVINNTGFATGWQRALATPQTSAVRDLIDVMGEGTVVLRRRGVTVEYRWQR